MNETKPFYITTTLPYVNSDPHIGHALEFVRADVLARAAKRMGREVFFNTGTDEHGVKIYQKAVERGITPQEHVDEYSQKFRELLPALHITSDVTFIRTTDQRHVKAAQEFWKVCEKNGYIYKKAYSGLYCQGCEMFVTDKDLINGECPHHPGKAPEEIEEENYFFKYSAFQDQLLDLYKKNPNFVIPKKRLNEIRTFVESGLEDFSISRLAEKMPWGISVPGDNEHVMYVWFDALVNYIATIGWPDDMETFNKFTEQQGMIQICGKDNLQHQAARWQAMLMAAGLPASSHILVNGFINSGGVKMSKSIGNVINPYDVVAEYGAEALRFYLLTELSQFEDGDFTMEAFHDAYTAHLVNGIGNLTNRILKMAESNLEEKVTLPTDEEMTKRVCESDIITSLFENSFTIKHSAENIFNMIGDMDQKIQKTEPFKLVKDEKTKEEGLKVMTELVQELYFIAYLLEPFLPETSRLVIVAIHEQKKPEEPIFARVEKK